MHIMWASGFHFYNENFDRKAYLRGHFKAVLISDDIQVSVSESSTEELMFLLKKVFLLKNMGGGGSGLSDCHVNFIC